MSLNLTLNARSVDSVLDGDERSPHSRSLLKLSDVPFPYRLRPTETLLPRHLSPVALKLGYGLRQSPRSPLTPPHNGLTHQYPVARSFGDIITASLCQRTEPRPERSVSSFTALLGL